jgi:hypothetical protein
MDVFTPVAPRGTVVGRYTLYDKLAASARAEVWLGRVRGQPGAPPLAIKRLHRELLCDPVFVSAVVTEARRASAVEHPNLARVRDVALIETRELLLVSEYSAGETLALLFGACFRSRTRMPLPVAMGIMVGVLRGLEAAHEARDGSGAALGIVHGGVSPQNVLVGADGVPRVLDLGLATARARAPATTALYAQGKRTYMSPEQARREPVDRRSDVYAAAVILWELLAGERLFRETAGADIALQITTHRIPRLCELHPDLPAELDDVLAPALARAAAARPATAAAFAAALIAIVPPASAAEIASWIREVARERLDERAELVAAVAEAPEPPEPRDTGTDPALEVAADSAPLPWVVSAPAPVRPTPRGRVNRLLLLAGALAAGLLIVSAVSARRRMHVPEEAAASAAPPGPVIEAAPTPPPVALPARRAIPVERVGQDRVPEVAAPVRHRLVTTSARRGALRMAAASPTVGAHVRGRAKPAVSPPPNCQPPFTVDAEGIRRIKRECLK